MTTKYLNENVGHALSSAIAEISKRQIDDPVGFIVDWLRASAESMDIAAKRKEREEEISRLRPALLAERENDAVARFKASKISRAVVDSTEQILHNLATRDTFSDEAWQEIVNTVLKSFPALSHVYLSKMEAKEDATVFRCIAASDDHLGKSEEQGQGFLGSLFPEEGEPAALFIPNVLADPRFPPGQFLTPGSILAVPIVFETRFTFENSLQLIADPESEISGSRVKLAFVFSTVGGSGGILNPTTRTALAKICAAAGKTKIRCEDSAMRRQVSFLGSTENEIFGKTKEMFEAADPAGKFSLAKEIVSQPEWISMLGQISVVSESGRKIAAAFVFVLRAASASEVPSWPMLRDVAISAGKAAANFDSTGARPGLPEEHRVKNIEELLVPLEQGQPLAIQLMHAFAILAISDRKADVQARREKLGALPEGQNAADLDADFE